MKIIVALSLILYCIAPQLSLAEIKELTYPLTLQGTVSLWTRDVCDTPLDCSLPTPIGVSWPIQVTLTRSTEPGPTIVAETELRARNWQVRLTWIWVNPNDNSTPYLVLQTQLRESLLGLIAECSRYDGINSFEFLPPGSCSGRNANKMYGVTFTAPNQGK